MSKKYVIDIEDKPFVSTSNYDSDDTLYRAVGFNSLVFDQTGLNKLKPYDPFTDRKSEIEYERNDAYQRGLNDAWEAARKITLNTNQGGVPTKELAMIFGEFNSCSEIMVRSTASEAVAKLKEYEQKQADDTPFKRIKAQIESMMHVQGINIADICMALEELMEEQE